jgi:ABC-type antimicrobial peptide transport system permease subunit
VASFVVATRQRELAIRLALGAPAARVVRTVTGRVCAATIAGVLAGSAAALSAASLTGSLLYGLDPYDPALLGAVVAAIAAVAMIAAAAPVRRALRTDPAAALKQE